MNPLNEEVRILRTNVEVIDKILENEHLDFKKGEELKIKREELQAKIKELLPKLTGV